MQLLLGEILRKRLRRTSIGVRIAVDDRRSMVRSVVLGRAVRRGDAQLAWLAWLAWLEGQPVLVRLARLHLHEPVLPDRQHDAAGGGAAAERDRRAARGGDERPGAQERCDLR